MLSAAYQWRKNVIIAIDVGSSLSDNQLQITKAVAKHLVLSLGDNDWVSFHFRFISCDRGQQGNDIPVPTPVHSSPKGNAVSFQNTMNTT